jgi:hypothetical protein
MRRVLANRFGRGAITLRSIDQLRRRRRSKWASVHRHGNRHGSEAAGTDERPGSAEEEWARDHRRIIGPPPARAAYRHGWDANTTLLLMMVTGRP